MAEEYEYTREVETLVPLRNEANVQALEKLLQEIPWAMTTRGWAEFLASRGVLVPSAMTPKDWESLEYAVMWEYIGLDDLGPPEEAKGQAALERIARGEQP